MGRPLPHVPAPRVRRNGARGVLILRPLGVFLAIVLALIHPQLGLIVACLAFTWLLLALYEWL